MSCARYIPQLDAGRFAPLALFLLFASALLHAQAQRPLTWLDDLTYLQNASDAVASREPVVAGIRTEVENWMKLHPNSGVELPPAPPRPWSAEQIHSQVLLLRDTVETILKEDPDRPFHLGVAEVNVAANASPWSPVTDSIDQTKITELNATRVSTALSDLPGVSIQHLDFARNEAGIMVRGFSSRGQVPLYLDGIPLYVPYDGYVDFNRFLTGDIAEVQVAKGYSSPLLGPNALGGAINMVTKEPVNKLEGEALMGTGAGNTLLSSLHLGSRWSRFFVQGSMDRTQDDFIPLPGSFPALQYTHLPNFTMSDQEDQSYSRDEAYSGRFGWTPNAQDEYVFSYINQKGQKGVPLYAGPNTNAIYPFFWDWPYWNMNSYYFLSNTALGDASSLKFRAFYDQFQNSINMYSNDTYTVMNTPNAEHSHYDDHTDGASTEFTTRINPKNEVSTSFFFADNTHREYGIYPARSLLTPALVDRDQQISLGIQDGVTLSTRMRAAIGFSADHLDGLQGQSYNTALTALIPFTCLASPQNTSFAGCTAHVWNLNPQASVSYALTGSDFLFLTFADRGRFPMLKDIYSTSMFQGLPNPDLQPEHSLNWNIGYSRTFSASTLMKVELFRSDLSNALETVYVTDPGGATLATAFCPNSRILGYCMQMINIGKEVHQGVELDVRSTALRRLTVDASYSYLNRTLVYDFANSPNVSTVNTSIQILPTLPRNKLLGNATLQLPRQVLAIVSARYEGGLVVQDTTYPSTSPFYKPFAESYGTMDLAAIIPIRAGVAVQAGVMNVLDRYYFYTPGYPQEGRYWYSNVRYRF